MKLEPNIVYKVNTSLDLKLYPIDIEGTGSFMLESGRAYIRKQIDKYFRVSPSFERYSSKF